MSEPTKGWRHRHPEIAEALVAPFYDDEVKFKPGKGFQAPFVTARTVMNRLDDVLGFENWTEEYIPTPHGCICRLTITLPDGEAVTKCDSGGAAGMSDQGDDEKSAFSDAFKRAAVKFGIGRYLYGSGVPVAYRHLFYLKEDGGVWAPKPDAPYNPRPMGEPSGPQGDPIAKVEQWLSGLADGYNAAWAKKVQEANLGCSTTLITADTLAANVCARSQAAGLTKPVRSDATHEELLEALLGGLRQDEPAMEEHAKAVYAETWKASVRAAKAANAPAST